MTHTPENRAHLINEVKEDIVQLNLILASIQKKIEALTQEIEVTQLCRYCNNAFPTKRKGTIYCSKRCQKRDERSRRGNAFADYLALERRRQQMTMAELAEKSQISAAQISRIETGERNTPKPATIRKLSEGLGVKYEDMMRAAGY